jgi:HlyD family secretion protein
LLCLVLLGLLGLRWVVRPRVALADLRLATVERGSLEATLSASGQVQPEYEDLLTSPTDTRVVALFARPGARLAAGDTLMQLDTRDILEQRRRLGDRIALTRAQLRELLARQRRDQADLASQRAILEERIRYLEARRMQEQELYDRQLTTVWTLRQAELDESITRLELKGLDERRTHLGEADRGGAEALEIQIRLLELDQEENREALERATLRAPRDCVLSWAVEEEGLALPKGSPLARLANRDSWKVQAELADVHTAEVREGLACTVRLGEPSSRGHGRARAPPHRERAPAIRCAPEEPP